MSTTSFSALRLSAAMLLQIVAGVGAISGTAYGVFELYSKVIEGPENAAKAQISAYEAFSTQRKKVDFVVLGVMRAMPLDACIGDRANWTNDCERARKRWRETLIERLDADAREEVYDLVKGIEAALLCASNGRCAPTMIRGYFLHHACTLWNQAWPYIVRQHRAMKTFAPLLFALSEEEDCPKVERTQMAMATNEETSSL